MHPPLAIRAFLDNAGLDYQEVSEDVVLTMIPTDKLIVRVVISCLNHVLRILVGLPAIVPKYRQAEFQRAFEKLNAKLDWGTIFLDEETVYISVGLE